MATKDAVILTLASIKMHDYVKYGEDGKYNTVSLINDARIYFQSLAEDNIIFSMNPPYYECNADGS